MKNCHTGIKEVVSVPILVTYRPNNVKKITTAFCNVNSYESQYTHSLLTTTRFLCKIKCVKQETKKGEVVIVVSIFTLASSQRLLCFHQ